MLKNQKNEEKRVKINVTPPGPEAKRIIEMDEKYLVTSTKSLPIVAKRGYGSFLEDVDGNVYLDFSTGISVNNLGHIHPKVKKAVEEQLDKLWHFAGTDFYYEEQVKAARALTEVAPGKFSKKVFFANSGTEANEAAIKISKAFTKKQQFISFIGGFHGRSQGSLSLTASKPIQRKGFFPTMPGVEHAPYPNPYRNPFGIDGYEEPEELENRVIDFIDRYMLKTYVPADNLAAFVVEPIQGEGGYIVPPKNFHKKLRKLADENNVLVVMDEVQTGFGRTGKFFASEHFGVEPEVISVAKAIASGIPMGGVIVNSRLDFSEPSLHSNTFGGNALASAACVATVNTIREEKLLENATKQGEYFKRRLNELAEKDESIGDVRGMGLMLALDFVKDRKTREPNAKLRDRVELKSLENGLILLSTGLSAIRIIPPLNVSSEEIDMSMECLEKAIRASH
ncbi:MAG: acetyl ornithine aminotransferase family protein [Candidatus Thermoplasmatota archaeon]|jgi:4-aminobutyrate aminotransferase|nr:acetyl ornithine aminotransferase family protein [Candidatus Thermoplasmatota archaeon]